MKTHIIVSIDIGKTYDKIQHPSDKNSQKNWNAGELPQPFSKDIHPHTQTANNILNSNRLKWEQGKDVHSHNSYSTYFSKFSSTQ